MKKIIDFVRLLKKPKLIGLLVKKLPVSISSFRNVENLKKYIKQVNTVIDVGANIGQFTLAVNYYFPNLKIYSFEPSKLAYKRLIKSLGNNKNVILFNFGLGDVDGEIEFYENSFDQISSFSKIDLSNNNKVYKKSKSVTTKAVIKKLDDIFNTINVIPPVLLKLDVQGLEDRVLMGALKSLKSIDYILLELAFEKLYEEQLLFNEMNELLKSLGYNFIAPMGFNLGDDNRIIEVDALFRKEELKN
ncbi:FkbM family methyltransferase [Stygiobacter electus]|uniref:FkbM family methyltransferase n=1 Tax=Stygiobacter electus TaxID=3032292 RepID=A0AAE3P2M2_9BACT|nr:FkbM family methyltransferase [Stygiobacter electus]MDF1613100.1 FkbM family methyltransferase [Stygiobacter electus]